MKQKFLNNSGYAKEKKYQDRPDRTQHYLTMVRQEREQKAGN